MGNIIGRFKQVRIGNKRYSIRRSQYRNIKRLYKLYKSGKITKAEYRKARMETIRND